MSYEAVPPETNRSTSSWLSPEDVCRSNPKQKQLGAFYTPTELSDILVNWAVRSGSETILEPGFGGCGFIESAQRRLHDLGVQTPAKQIYGCDIDDVAYDFLGQIIQDSRIDVQFPKIDFMSAQARVTWDKEFDVVIGNPPYVAYQLIAAKNRLDYQRCLNSAGFTGISARASLWAYFILHATTFLKTGGRVAWVLPGSFLQANYAESVRSCLERLFSRIYVCRINDRLFTRSGADEETVVLLAEGYGLNPSLGEVSYAQIENLSQLALKVDRWQNNESKFDHTVTSCISAAKGISAHLLPSPPGVIKIRRLGELVRVKIGVVTGDNKYFVISSEQARSNDIDVAHLLPILSKFNIAPGANLTKKDMEIAATSNAKCWLVSSSKLPSGVEAIDRYLLSYPKEKIATTSTFKKRALWHSPYDNSPPDAFWPVMRDIGPRLVLNDAAVNCTNTIHRVYSLPGTSQTEMLLIFLGVLSTLGQLSAEIKGRHYGSGVLKHEPRDVESIEVPWVEGVSANYLRDTVESADSYLRENNFDGARRLADEFFITEAPNINKSHINESEKVLYELRRKRMPNLRRA